MKSKICFVIPYFGNFKEYFQLFLNSCQANKDINWLIVTDNNDDYNFPKNVKKIDMTFGDLRKKIQNKFEFEIPLSKPYKLCDFKVTYGYIFEDELKGYDFWGYCDTDIIFGNIKRFITEEVLQKYDKIGYLGHFTLIKNTFELNRAFMLPLNGKEIYREILSSDENYSFDEEFNSSINNIFLEHNYRIFTDMNEAKKKKKTSNFKLTKMNFSSYTYEVEKLKRAFFVYEDGSLFRYVESKNKIEKSEYLYIHFQSRPMKVDISLDSKRYKIIPNSFDRLEVYPITVDNFNSIQRKHFNMHYFKLRSHNLVDKIQKYVRVKLNGKS